MNETMAEEQKQQPTSHLWNPGEFFERTSKDFKEALKYHEEASKYLEEAFERNSKYFKEASKDLEEAFERTSKDIEKFQIQKKELSELEKEPSKVFEITVRSRPNRFVKWSIGLDQCGADNSKTNEEKSEEIVEQSSPTVE